MKHLSIALGLLMTGLGSTAAAPEVSDRVYDAVRRDDREAVKALVMTQGINLKDKRDGTPLHYAAAAPESVSIR